MKPAFFTQTERTIILYRAASLTTQQIADKLGLQFHQVNDCNKAIHRKVKAIYPNQVITGMLVLGLAVALGEVTKRDLKFIYATLHIRLNKLP